MSYDHSLQRPNEVLLEDFTRFVSQYDTNASKDGNKTVQSTIVLDIKTTLDLIA